MSHYAGVNLLTMLDELFDKAHATSDEDEAILDEIPHLTVSEYRTYSVKCQSLNDEYYEDLARRCREADIEIENWTTSITWLCKKCSEGEPH